MKKEMKKVQKEKKADWVKIDDFLPIINLEKEKEFQGILEEINVRGKNNSNLYTIRNGVDKRCFWGSFQLDQRLSKIPIGYEIKIIYKGKIKTTGGKEVKDFDVFCRS